MKLCGMVKGAGMIRPDVATMLSFLVTDANIKGPLLQQMLEKAAEDRITGSPWTERPAPMIRFCSWRMERQAIPRSSEWTGTAEIFQSMLSEVCQELAKSVVKDGEGATKFIEIQVKGARNEEDAKKAAYAIAHSPLVKTAFFGEDANWGRILCALGHSGARIDPNRIDVSFDNAPIVKNGMGVDPRLEERASQVIKKKSFR